MDDYDCGLINDWGGGNVDWWQDYIRAEIGRANDHWRAQIAALTPASDGRAEALRDAADWSGLPDVYVTRVRTDGIIWEIEACSVPMAIGPEVRLSISRAAELEKADE